MLDLKLRPRTWPDAIYRCRDSIYATDLLVAAVCWLGFFDRLNERPATLEMLCRVLDIKERPADVLLTLLTALGLVRNEEGLFSLTDVAREYLVSDAPWYVGPYYATLKERAVCKDFLHVLRTDTPATWCSAADEQQWAAAMHEEPFATTFTAAMDSRGAYLAPIMASRLDCSAFRRALDVAGGSGIYVCALVAAHPHLAATVLEKPPVDRVAAALIAQRGFGDRVSVVAGDMFADPFPGDCDVHLFSNVLHDWNVPQVRRLLAQSFAALRPGGLVVIHDAHLNAAKSGPLPVAEYSALVLHATEGRCYSVAEMGTFLRDAGFGEPDYSPTALDRSLLTARKPP